MPIKTKTIKHRKLFKGKTIQYHLYTEKEARELGIKYKYWKTVKDDELPCYVLDDDGIVGMFLQKRLAGIGNIYYYYSPWGNFIVSPKDRKRIGVHLYKDLRAVDEDRGRKNSKHIQALKKMYAYYIARGLSKQEIEDLLNLSGEGVCKFNRWMETEEFSLLVKKELNDILTAVGMTKEKVVEQYVEAYNKAKSKGDVKGMIEATDRIASLHMMNVKLTASIKEVVTSEKKDDETAKKDQAKILDMIEEKETRSEQRTLKATTG